jgi:hypothetical protein
VTLKIKTEYFFMWLINKKKYPITILSSIL